MRALLIDNHDSYTYNLFHLLARVNGCEPHVVTNDAIDPLHLDAYDAVVLSPGPGTPERARDFGICADVLRRTTVPVLGVCLGHQGLAAAEGARVEPAPTARHGHLTRVTHDGDAMFAGIPDEFRAVRYHSLCVAEPVPEELLVTARAEDGVVMALRHRSSPRWGVQFHPESIESEHGERLLANFRDLARGRQVAPSLVQPRTTPTEHRYRANVVELQGAVDAETAFAHLFSQSANAFWLDSSRVEDGLSRFSFLGDGSGPLSETLVYRVGSGDEPVLDRLQRELATREVEAPPLPFDFTGGYVGYFGYELKADCGSPNRHRASTPDAAWLFADRFVAIDHLQHRTYLVALSEGDRADAVDWLADTAARLSRAPELDEPEQAEAGPVEPALTRGRAEYVRDVLRCKEHLLAGESYEICLTASAELPAVEPALETYRRLRRRNPAPYSAFLRLGGVEVACSSPERFLEVGADRVVEAKPIKGTAPRGAGAEEDARLRSELAADPKTRAENLMIVDLMRNDLGRVCAVDSVHVPELMAVETYETVHQLVSTIRGRLRPDRDVIDCVRACFPGGSMTGAPKPRTLELIGALEDRARGVYSGSIGYLGCSGAADLNIVIRTMVLVDGRWEVGAGGAIVLDSDPEAEFDEMLLKAAAPTRALPSTGSADGGGQQRRGRTGELQA
ncbi:aminodeoxychorismate synthase component I [Saccharopolyspora rhizosphaerae]|uniref:aminodeoxychorismate synthase n=1 Tax=Saccharopolyspora rhizosphaerae TaxID=2492662 RepID=A0A426JLV8_9PSEU|nr:aminodeoxychorismate synthase component I [Saccharopolyspora rhizosphaerae]RRO14212.1 aminodeoxychorismate synthase component I [Saccharopolyspora rhizosphaerae]